MKTPKLVSIIVLFHFNLCYAQFLKLHVPDLNYIFFRMSMNQQTLNLIPCIAYPAYNLDGKNCATSITAPSEVEQLPILGVRNPQFFDEKILSPLVVATADSYTRFYSDEFKTGQEFITKQYDDVYTKYNEVRMYTNVRTAQTIRADAQNNLEYDCNNRPCTIFDGDEYFYSKLYDSRPLKNLRLDKYDHQQISPREYFMEGKHLKVRFRSNDVSSNFALITNEITPKIGLYNGKQISAEFHFKKLAKEFIDGLSKKVCANQGYNLLCLTNRSDLTVHYVLGYGDSQNPEDLDFPHLIFDVESLELEAYAIVVDLSTNNEIYRKRIWKSRFDWKYETRHLRELVEEIHSTKTEIPDFKFNVKTEITSGDIFGDDHDEWWASADDKYFASITTNDTGIPDKEYDEILLEITELKEETVAYVDEEDEDGDGDTEEEIIDATCPDLLDKDGDGDLAELITCTFTYPEVVNTIEAENYTDGHFIALKVQGDKAVFVSKTQNDAVVQTLAENCISPFPNNEHFMTIDEGVFSFKTGDQLVWQKLKGTKDDSIHCAFPIVGQSSLNTNQNWIEYNHKPNNNELHYLLSEDKTKITIKVGNELRVIEKQAFINANYSFLDAIPLQTFK